MFSPRGNRHSLSPDVVESGRDLLVADDVHRELIYAGETIAG